MWQARLLTSARPLTSAGPCAPTPRAPHTTGESIRHVAAKYVRIPTGASSVCDLGRLTRGGAQSYLRTPPPAESLCGHRRQVREARRVMHGKGDPAGDFAKSRRPRVGIDWSSGPLPNNAEPMVLQGRNDDPSGSVAANRFCRARSGIPKRANLEQHTSADVCAHSPPSLDCTARACYMKQNLQYMGHVHTQPRPRP